MCGPLIRIVYTATRINNNDQAYSCPRDLRLSASFMYAHTDSETLLSYQGQQTRNKLWRSVAITYKVNTLERLCGIIK